MPGEVPIGRFRRNLDRRIRRRQCPLILAATMMAWSMAATGAVAAEADDRFESNVRPLLIERCHKCHAGTMTKGGLRLDSREAVLRGGESGPAIVAGKPDESLLMQAVRHQNGLEMPPDGKLTEPQIAELAAWIEAGDGLAGKFCDNFGRQSVRIVQPDGSEQRRAGEIVAALA